MLTSNLLTILFITGAIASEQVIKLDEDVSNGHISSSYESSYNPILIALPEEVKEIIDPPSPIKSWNELEWMQFRKEPFNYDISESSYEDFAKLHVLNANSGKFYNKLSDHAKNFDGDLNDVDYDDFIYLYYNSNDDSLELDYSISYFTGYEANSNTIFLADKFFDDKSKFGVDYVESHRKEYYTTR